MICYMHSWWSWPMRSVYLPLKYTETENMYTILILYFWYYILSFNQHLTFFVSDCYFLFQEATTPRVGMIPPLAPKPTRCIGQRTTNGEESNTSPKGGSLKGFRKPTELVGDGRYGRCSFSKVKVKTISQQKRHTYRPCKEGKQWDLCITSCDICDILVALSHGWLYLFSLSVLSESCHTGN